LPSKEKVSFVVTTREQPDRFGGIDTLPLDQLTIGEGQQLLFRFRPIESSDPGDAEWKASRSMVSEFGGHAWALEIAAVYLRHNPSITYEAYHAGLKAKGISVKLDQAGRWAGDTGAIHHNEKFLADLLIPTLAKLDPVDRRVLEYAAWLPPDLVCLPWLRDLAEHDFPGSFQHDSDDPDPWTDGVVRRLLGWQLLTSSSDDSRFVRMHRLTQEVLRKEEVGPPRFDRLLRFAESRQDWFKENWHRRDNQWELTPLIQSSALWLDANLERAEMLANNVANRCRVLGNLTEAKRLSLCAIEIDEKAYERDHPILATGYSNLALVEKNLGNFTDARKLLLRAIEIFEKAYEPDHPTLATSYSNLAMVELDLGNLTEVRKLMRQAYAIRRSRLGNDHPDTRLYRQWLIDNDPEFDQ
jgi:hypothetical protein